MQPVEGSKCLVPDLAIATDFDRVMSLLLGVEPPPIEWVLSRKVSPVASGFKIMVHQIRHLPDESVFWRYLADNQIKVIVNTRNNILLQYVSDLIVQKTKQPTCWDGNIRRAKVHVPIDTLKNKLIQIREEKRYLLRRAASLDHQILKYEEFKDNVKKVEALLPWLIGSDYHLKSKLSKQNPDNLHDRVTNYHDVVQEVRRIGMDDLIDRR